MKFVFYSVVGLAWLGIVVLPGVYGWEYYMTPVPERPFTELHDQLKPTGFIGHGYGVIGSLFMIVGVATYTLRKRVAWFAKWGKLRSWLRFHIFLCTTGPALVVWHTSLKFQGVVAISFWSMVIVVASGVLGRYVYKRIPKTEDGYFKSVQFVVDEKLALRKELDAMVSLSPVQESMLGLTAGQLKFTNPWAALYAAILFDVRGLFSWSRDRRVTTELALSRQERESFRSLVRRYRWRTRQEFLIEPMQKIFGYWHVFHIPLATIMFLVLAVHVFVSILFGYTWIF
ncbi:MAG: hypothetical protein DA443_07935 [Bacteroidetes bacterium]|jgi:hypothetical protein|nr:MAG: hypothetical protein DA443_07935 [Bacteroidota bacterium]